MRLGAAFCRIFERRGRAGRQLAAWQPETIQIMQNAACEARLRPQCWSSRAVAAAPGNLIGTVAQRPVGTMLWLRWKAFSGS